MLSRSIGIVVAPFFALLSLMVPLGSFYSANAIVGGVAATVLASLAMLEERAAIGVAALGVWTAFTPLVFRSTLVEMIASVCWGVTMVVAFVGPFSHAPAVAVNRAGSKDVAKKPAAAKEPVRARTVSARIMKFT